MALLRRSGSPGARPGSPVAQASADPRDWPPVGQSVVLVLGRRDEGHRSEVRLHDRAQRLLEIEAPHVAGEPILADRGDTITLTWTSESGLHAIRTLLVDTGDRPPVWRLETTSPVALVNRRRFPRVRVRMRAALKLGAGQQAQPVAVLDVSEGGFRCVAPADLEVGKGAKVVANLPVGGQDVVAVGEIAWHRHHGTSREIGVEIKQLSKGDLAHIRDIVKRMLRSSG